MRVHRRYARLLPPREAALRADPYAALPARQEGVHGFAGEPLLFTEHTCAAVAIPHQSATGADQHPPVRLPREPVHTWVGYARHRDGRESFPKSDRDAIARP